MLLGFLVLYTIATGHAREGAGFLALIRPFPPLDLCPSYRPGSSKHFRWANLWEPLVRSQTFKIVARFQLAPQTLVVPKQCDQLSHATRLSSYP
jgi:hypothetical protein